MRTTKRVLQAAGITAGAIGAIAATAPGNPIGRGARRLGDRLTRDLRYAAATTPGLVYRLAGRYPDPDVSDQVIADRVRSKLGPIEHRFDLPRIDVRVEDDVEAAVHAVLCGFTDRLPETERARLLAHLPPDARALAGPPRRRGEQPPRLKTVPQLVAAVVAEGGVNPSVAEDVTRY